MATVATPTVTEAGLKARLGAASMPDAEATRLLDTAHTIMAGVFVSAWRDVPVEIVDEVIVRIARALRDAGKAASSGAQQVTAGEAQPLRAPADPLVSSYPIIRRFVVMGL